MVFCKYLTNWLSWSTVTRNSTSGYLPAGSFGLYNLFLAYMGDKVTSSGAVQPQDWYATDFEPVLTHINLTTNLADGTMFTQYLFLPFTVQDSSGLYKWIGYTNSFPTGSAPATSTDWQTYIETLFASDKNIGALYSDALAAGNGLNRNIPTDIWVAYPYPYTSVFGNNHSRLIALENWISSFISQWQASVYASADSPLTFRGFYWDAESVINTDAKLIQNINSYVRSNTPYATLWIPYQGANQWSNWKSLGFSASVLQPNYYFDPNKSLQTGVYNAYSVGEGVEMEMDLAVTWDPPSRSRFIDYLNYGVTGGSDSNGDYFPPYMTSSAHAWYTGGWYPTGTSREEAIVQLYQNRDPLYDNINQFVHGTYIAGTAQ